MTFLSKVKHIDFFHMMSSEDLKAVLDSCTNLVTLRLHWYYGPFHFAQYLMPQLKELKTVVLVNRQTDFDQINLFFKNHTQLTALCIEFLNNQNVHYAVDLSFVSHLPNLEKLQLKLNGSDITGTASLSHLNHLQEFSIPTIGVEFSDYQRILKHFGHEITSSLFSQNDFDVSFSEKEMSLIFEWLGKYCTGNLEKFVITRMRGYALPPTAITFLSKVKDIEFLCWLSSRDLKAVLDSCKNLVRLSVNGYDGPFLFANYLMPHLKEFETFVLVNSLTDFDQIGTFFKNHTQLTALYIHLLDHQQPQCGVDLSFFSHLPNLEKLHLILNGSNITGAASLSHLNHLQKFFVDSYGRGTDLEILERLGSVESLTKLELSIPDVSNVLRGIERFKNLSKLGIFGRNIIDISSLAQLRCNCTDLEIDCEMLAEPNSLVDVVRNLKKLEKIELDCQVALSETSYPSHSYDTTMAAHKPELNILDLNGDCLLSIFNYLSLMDLCTTAELPKIGVEFSDNQRILKHFGRLITSSSFSKYNSHVNLNKEQVSLIFEWLGKYCTGNLQKFVIDSMGGHPLPPTAITFLSKVKRIKFFYPISSEDLKAVLDSCKNLVTLILQWYNGPFHFANYLMPHLKEFETVVRVNSLTDFDQIGTFFKNHTQLTDLCIQFLGHQQPQCDVDLSFLSHLPNLEKLNLILNGSNITGTASFGHLNHLQEFFVDDSYGKETDIEILERLGSTESLKTLEITMPDFSIDGSYDKKTDLEILELLGSVESLVTLEFIMPDLRSNCSVLEVCCRMLAQPNSLVDVVRNLKKLKKIELACQVALSETVCEDLAKVCSSQDRQIFITLEMKPPADIDLDFSFIEKFNEKNGKFVDIRFFN
ncbi:hypothetical protein Bhyg_04772, partial [Pseudolycoriella hygida]